MFVVLLFLWLIVSPATVSAQTDTPTPTETITPTEAPTATPTQALGPSATPTPAPPATGSPSVTTPTKSIMKQTNTSQTGGFGGPGLSEEKEEDGGLGFDNERVLGTTKEVDDTGDKDLLSTLIFLTGAVVLVVWTIYIVLVQKGVIKSGVKKDKNRGGITPQPID